MATAAPVAAAPAAAPSQSVVSMTIDVFGFPINLVGVSIILGLAGIFYLFWRIQKTDKLDFADLITKDGKSVSLTKVLQLIGGFTATWIMIKLTLTGGLTDILFGIYLSYVAGVEGYSKFVSAKYGYKEKSVRDARYSDEDEYEDEYRSPGSAGYSRYRPGRHDPSRYNPSRYEDKRYDRGIKGPEEDDSFDPSLKPPKG